MPSSWATFRLSNDSASGRSAVSASSYSRVRTPATLSVFSEFTMHPPLGSAAGPKALSRRPNGRIREFAFDSIASLCQNILKFGHRRSGSFHGTAYRDFRFFRLRIPRFGAPGRNGRGHEYRYRWYGDGFSSPSQGAGFFHSAWHGHL